MSELPLEGDQPSYADAMRRIEEILAHIESDDVNVDALLERVTEAAALIKLCKSKLTETETQVRNVLETLEDD